MSNLKLFVLLGLVCATLAHFGGRYEGHRDEGDYDEPSHDIDWGHNIEFPKHHTWLEYPEIDDEAPFRKTKDIIEDPNKGIMTLEERQPVKRSIRIRNKQRAKDPKYRKGLEELADLV